MPTSPTTRRRRRTETAELKGEREPGTCDSRKRPRCEPDDCVAHVVLSQLKVATDAYNGDGEWDFNLVVNGEEQNVELKLGPHERRGNVAFFNVLLPGACGDDVELDFSGAVTGGPGTDRLQDQAGEFDGTETFHCPSAERKVTYTVRVKPPGAENANLFADFTLRFRVHLHCRPHAHWV